MKNIDYIPVKNHWFEMYTQFEKPYWEPKEKLLIKKIRINKDLFDYQNVVDEAEVLFMLMNFDRDAWMPITINKDFFLIDGQHRLSFAKKMGLKFIDVVIQDTELLEN
ncbi:MAG: hypothetical protein HQ541_18360 [Mariniphaga sp.]|nr:hypothetical protein [Mariniphaga sp.]